MSGKGSSGKPKKSRQRWATLRLGKKKRGGPAGSEAGFARRHSSGNLELPSALTASADSATHSALSGVHSAAHSSSSAARDLAESSSNDVESASASASSSHRRSASAAVRSGGGSGKGSLKSRREKGNRSSGHVSAKGRHSLKLHHATSTVPSERLKATPVVAASAKAELANDAGESGRGSPRTVHNGGSRISREPVRRRGDSFGAGIPRTVAEALGEIQYEPEPGMTPEEIEVARKQWEGERKLKMAQAQLKQWEGERKLAEAKAQLRAQKEMTRRAEQLLDHQEHKHITNYLARFVSKLQRKKGRNPRSQENAASDGEAQPLPVNSSSLKPGAARREVPAGPHSRVAQIRGEEGTEDATPDSKAIRRLSTQYLQQFFLPLSPDRREPTQTEREVNHLARSARYLNMFLEPPEETTRGGNAVVAASSDNVEDDDEEEDEEEEESSVSSPVIGRRRALSGSMVFSTPTPSSDALRGNTKSGRRETSAAAAAPAWRKVSSGTSRQRKRLPLSVAVLKAQAEDVASSTDEEEESSAYDDDDDDMTDTTEGTSTATTADSTPTTERLPQVIGMRNSAPDSSERARRKKRKKKKRRRRKKMRSSNVSVEWAESDTSDTSQEISAQVGSRRKLVQSMDPPPTRADSKASNIGADEGKSAEDEAPAPAERDEPKGEAEGEAKKSGGGEQQAEEEEGRGASTVPPETPAVAVPAAAANANATDDSVDGDDLSSSYTLKKRLSAPSLSPMKDGRRSVSREPSSGRLVVEKRSMTEEEVAKELTLGEELGKGAFSLVYQATRTSDNMEVAVKLVDTSRLTSKQLQELDAERSILSSLDHESIVKLLGIYETPTRLYMLLELVKQGDLFNKVLSKGCYSERASRHIMTQILDAVRYLHRLFVCHRDLKPENILCWEHPKTKMLTVKLADFGIAKRLGRKRARSTCGSPGYVAPEVIRGDEYDFAVDMFSMGAIAFVLLAGYPPFWGDDMQTILAKNIAVEYEYKEMYWSHISADAKDFIDNLLEKDPAYRMAAEEAVGHPWLAARRRRKKKNANIEGKGPA